MPNSKIFSYGGFGDVFLFGFVFQTQLISVSPTASLHWYICDTLNRRRGDEVNHWYRGEQELLFFMSRVNLIWSVHKE